MVPGIDPKVDYAFQVVFASEGNVDVLTSLLEAVLGLAAGSLRDVAVLNPFNRKETAGDKLSIVDIKARDATGRLFNVEMQMLAHAALRERIVYYWSKVYSGQLPQGRDFDQLRPAVSICFVNDTIVPELPDVWHHRAGLYDPKTGLRLTDHVDIHFIELP